MATGENLRRVGRAVAAQRGELGMTQQELADAAGVDLKTVYNLESGTRWPIARTRVAISGALGWKGDALADLAAGIAPAEDVPPPPLTLLPAAEATAREAGIDPYDPDDPWTAPVREAIETAKDIHKGTRPTGAQIFYGKPTSSYEAGIWDDRSLNEDSKVVAIAILRSWRARDEAGRQGPGRRRIGLTSAVTTGGR